MTVKVNMSPVSQFDMRKALSVWTRRWDRHARQSLSSKYTDQEYCVGFFSSTHSSAKFEKKNKCTHSAEQVWFGKQIENGSVTDKEITADNIWL